MTRLRALGWTVCLCGMALLGCVGDVVVGWQVPNTGDLDVWIEEFPDGPGSVGKVYVANRTGEEIDLSVLPEQDWGRVTLAPNESGHYEVSYGADLTVEYATGDRQQLLSYRLCSDAASSVKGDC